MDRNGKWMKPEATRSTEAPIDVKSLQSWASQMPWASRHRLLMETTKNMVLLCWRTLMNFWKWCELKKNHLLMTKSSLSGHFSNVKVLQASKALELNTCRAQHTIVLDIDDQFLCSDVHTEAGYRYDELWRSFETVQRNVNKLLLNVKRKKVHALATNGYAWTCWNNKVLTPSFVKKKHAFNRDEHLNGCEHKREITCIAISLPELSMDPRSTLGLGRDTY